MESHSEPEAEETMGELIDLGFKQRERDGKPLTLYGRIGLSEPEEEGFDITGITSQGITIWTYVGNIGIEAGEQE